MGVLATLLAGCGGGSSSPSGGSSSPPTPPSVAVTEPPPPATTPPPPAVATSLEGQLNAILADFSKRSGGAAVLVRKDNEIVYRGTVGNAVSATSTAITPTTAFRLASISKTFTALAVMQLVEDGILSLDDSILSYLPELPDAWASITIEMLLSHRSGIIDVVNDILPSTWLAGYTNADVITYLVKNPELEFTPGSMADYSNSGYILLAEIIARASGLSFYDYMKGNVFDPAGMTQSYITDETHPLRPGDALAYGDRNTFFGTTLYLKGAMAQVSSIEDFGAFLRALKSNTLVSAASFNLMQQNPHNSMLFGRGYGYGLMLEGSRIGHEGIWDGYQTKLTMDPATGIDIVVLCSGGSSMQSLISRVHSTVYDFH